MRTILPASKNSALRKKAQEIPPSEITGKRTQRLIKEMKTLLAKEEHGVALAAPQVGESLRLFIISGRALLRQAQDKLPAHPSREYLQSEQSTDLSRAQSRDQVYINPELIKMSRGRREKHEGCLSVRGKWGMVPRAEKATIRAYNERGSRFTRGASGFLAHIFQHEMDHLEGILYTDKAMHLYDESEKGK
ncbi:peptide deformylase [Candidatus Kaiserbacteria bacterium]|nr:peptide deformylase [Candidatus Kaiserbacteria bacterium]